MPHCKTVEIPFPSSPGAPQTSYGKWWWGQGSALPGQQCEGVEVAVDGGLVERRALEAGQPQVLMLPAKGRWSSVKACPRTEPVGAGGCLCLRWSPTEGRRCGTLRSLRFLCNLLSHQSVGNVIRTDQASVTTMLTLTWLRRRARTRKTLSHPPRFPRGPRSRNVS